MFEFTVNGQQVTAYRDGRLIDFLRDELGLLSVKNGCKEGACGTCTVLTDGRATKACVMSLKNMTGKAVVTVEGLSEREKAVYSYAFVSAGAVQCGFCTPGMVMSAKGLIDSVPDPSASQVKDAIKNAGRGTHDGPRPARFFTRCFHAASG